MFSDRTSLHVQSIATARFRGYKLIWGKFGGLSMRKSWLALVATVLTVGGCAKDSSDIQASYVSPILYQNYTCQQIGDEATRISAKAAEVAGVQNQHATNDKVAMGVGLVVFWPALFLMKGNDENAVELAHLKGLMDALEEASIKKKCGITFQHVAPVAPKSAQPMPEYPAES